MPASLKRPTLEELYKHLSDLDYTQVDERLAVMLNAILQLEAQVECRESATEAVLMVGYTSEGITQFTFGPPPIPPLIATRPPSERLGARVDSSDSSRSSRSRQLGSTPMEAEEAESSTPQS